MSEWNQQKSAAVTKLSLRLAVAGYVLYLMYRILEGTLNGTSPIAPMLSYIICALFFLSAIGFGLYSFRQFLKAINDSVETPDQGSESDVDLND